MNIELHGFAPKSAPEIQQLIWSKLIANLPRSKSAECNVSIVQATTQGIDGRICPFIRIYSDKKQDFKFALKILKNVKMPGAGQQTFVECVVLNLCAVL